MHRPHRLALALPALLSALLLGACGNGDDAQANTATSVPAPAAAPATTRAAAAAPTHHQTAPRPAVLTAAAHPESRGEVVSITPITEQSSPSGAGAVLGGVLGGVLGHQVGGGDGRKAATVLGAVGGAVVGNRVEKNRSTHVVGYRVDVRTGDGTVREFRRTTVGDLAVGTSVRIVDGGVQPA